MPYVPRTVPAYAVRDPAYAAEVFALTLVQIDVRTDSIYVHVSMYIAVLEKVLLKLAMSSKM